MHSAPGGPPEVRETAGTWLRTLRALSPRQILGRPSFRVRRALSPHVLSHAGRLAARTTPPAWNRLVETPCTPLDREQLAALEEGELFLFQQRAALPLRPPFEPQGSDALYAYGFHELGWLRAALAAPGASSALKDRLARWLVDYLEASPRVGSPAWDPYPLAGRILQLAALDRAQVPAQLVLRRVAEWTCVLAGLSETHLLGNHLLRDRTALAVGAPSLAAGLAPALRAHAWRALARTATAQFLGDGGHEERTPGYHALAALELVQCLATTTSAATSRPGTAARVEAVTARALAALEVVTHEDGLVAAFGDTAPRTHPSGTAVLAWARASGVRWAPVPREVIGQVTRRTLPDSGFSRLEAGPLTLFLTHGPFGALYQPGHAHCDLFAFELDLAGRRLIVDPGVHAYHEPGWRRRTRSAAEHNTISLPGREQAEIWSRFRCGWRPRVTRADWEPWAGGWRFIGEALAFGPTNPVRLRRTIDVSGDEVAFEDEVIGGEPFAIRLTAAPGSDVAVRGPKEAEVRAPTGARLRLTVRAGSATLSEAQAFCSHAFGAREPAAGVSFTCGGGRLRWALERAS